MIYEVVYEIDQRRLVDPKPVLSWVVELELEG